MSKEKATAKVRLVGGLSDDGKVRLDEFSLLCKHLQKTLREIEESIRRDAPHQKFRVVNLACESATIEVEPVPGLNGHGEEIVAVFQDTIEKLELGERIDSRLSVEALGSFRDLLRPIKRKPHPGSQRFMQVGRVEVSPKALDSLARYLEPPLRSKGTVSGRIDTVHVHLKNEFVIFPPTGLYSVHCTFDEKLLQKVRESLKRHVTVEGDFFYPVDAPFPTKAHIRDILIHDPDDQLPAFDDLVGSMRTTGHHVDSVNQIRLLRDEYE